MPQYPEHLLTDDEVVLRDFHPHWRVLLVAIAWVVGAIVVASLALANLDDQVGPIVAGVAVLVGLLVAIPAVVNRQFSVYVLTSERLITRSGIIAKSGVEIPLEQINNILFQQTVVERALGYGDVVIESAGSQGQTVFTDIPDPQGFQSEVYRAREDRGVVLRGGGPVDPTAQLERLAKLRAVGDLSDDEYEYAKQRLLGGL